MIDRACDDFYYAVCHAVDVHLSVPVACVKFCHFMESLSAYLH